MTEPISDPAYWRKRLREAKELHQAIFHCPLDRWRRIEAKHRQILARHVRPYDSVLDAGCGWGRLLDLMPSRWKGDYWGVDLSPDFIDLAKREHPAQAKQFLVGDLRQLEPFLCCFDWAVMISVRPMVKRNEGEGSWAAMEAQLRLAARNLLYLECDEKDEGTIE